MHPRLLWRETPLLNLMEYVDAIFSWGNLPERALGVLHIHTPAVDVRRALRVEGTLRKEKAIAGRSS